jgi:leucyl-tRNA synthetase
MNYDGAFEVVIKKLEENGMGKRKVNYKMRDAAFSRQRYWGEPFPIIWKDGIAYPLDESELSLELPYVESYKPGPEGEGPLANVDTWAERNLETNTMPGYAGSSWYFLRYMDPHNEEIFCDKSISAYWNQVDLYVGGTEHAVGHLLYSRMWTKALYDLELISFDEPFKRLLNQGMVQGSSRFIYSVVDLFFDNTNWPLVNYNISPLIISSTYYEKLKNATKEERQKVIYKICENIEEDHFLETIKEENLFYTIDELSDKIEGFTIPKIHVDISLVDGVELNIDQFKKWRSGHYADAKFVLEDGKYICATEVEKMSKSKLNTVNPDDLVEKYGADTFRMYEMFLGPVEMSKPWDTKGIEGVHRFLKKLWRLFYHENNFIVTDEQPSPEELKVLHKAIKKIEEDTERFSFNTCVSAFMVCVNDLTDLKCHKKDILVPLIILLTPYAPHISCEFWEMIKVSPTIGGGDLEGAVLDASFPKLEQKYLVETSKEYPISVNGKLRTTINIDLEAEQKKVEEIVLQNGVIQKWLEGKQPKKIIFVKNKMVNVVV